MGCVQGSSADGNFGKSLLSANNKLRSKHGSSPMKWSPSAASKAKEWAKHIADSGLLEHGNHDGMGQNIAYMMGREPTAQDIADLWYKEISDYNFDQPGFNNNTGHFTQMVWDSSTQMGAAIVTNGNKYYIVANYIPAGNITNEGQFEKNVKRPKN